MFSLKNYINFAGNRKCNFVCRRCLSSYSSENVLNKHKQRCNQQAITSARTSNASHLYWKNIFIRIHYIFKKMQIFKRIMKLIIVVKLMKQLIFINKIEYLTVII